MLYFNFLYEKQLTKLYDIERLTFIINKPSTVPARAGSTVNRQPSTVNR
jgi:hypothetical protein